MSWTTVKHEFPIGFGKVGLVMPYTRSIPWTTVKPWLPCTPVRVGLGIPYEAFLMNGASLPWGVSLGGVSGEGLFHLPWASGFLLLLSNLS